MKRCLIVQSAILSASLGILPATVLAGETDPAAPAAAAAAAAESPEATAEKTGPKILVLPYQAIFRSVEQKKIQTATDLLNKELTNSNGVTVIRGAVADESAATPNLEEAAKYTEAAEKLESQNRINEAIEKRRKTIEVMEKNAAAITDATEYVQAHHLLARALMWAAKDDEARSMLDAAARMAPNMKLEPGDYSRLYRKWFERSAKQVVREPRGDLFVKSALPGAHISFDGRPMDVAPVVLKKAVPGKHLLAAEVEGVPRFATIVEIKKRSKTETTVRFGNTMGGTAVGVVADAISQNTVSKSAVQSAAKAGKDAGATFVIAGGIARDDENFRVHTFVVDVAKTAIKHLDVVKFDLDLLTAESDVLRVVQKIDDTVKSFANGSNAIATIEKRARRQDTINQVSAAPSARGRAAPIKKGGKKEKREVFKPLKGSKIKIKDEEE